MTPSIEELHDESRYTPVWQIDHDNAVAAIRPLILVRGGWSAGYVAANVAALLVVAWAWRRGDLLAFEA